MPSFRAVVTARRKNGEWPVYIRMVHRRKARLLHTGLVATDGDLSRRELRSPLLVERAEAIMRRMRENCNRYGENIDELDADVVARIAERKADFDRDFIAFCGRYADRLEADGRTGTAAAKRAAACSLRKFVGRDVLHFHEVTVQLMTEWRQWLRASGKSTSANYFRNVAHMFREARRAYNDEDAGIVRIPNDPFRTVKPDRPPVARKKALDPADLIRIRDAEGLSPALSMARDVFMISFCMMGMNGSDIYEAPEPEGGRITYNRRKTRRRRADGAEMSVRLEPELLPYLERHRGTDGRHAFDFHEHYLARKGFVQSVSVAMRKLGKRLGIEGLTFYAARHTWATLAANDCGVDIYTVEKALCHKPQGLSVTETYIKPDYRRIDEANRRVLDFVEEAGL